MISQPSTGHTEVSFTRSPETSKRLRHQRRRYVSISPIQNIAVTTREELPHINHSPLVSRTSSESGRRLSNIEFIPETEQQAKLMQELLIKLSNQSHLN